MEPGCPGEAPHTQPASQTVLMMPSTSLHVDSNVSVGSSYTGWCSGPQLEQIGNMDFNFQNNQCYRTSRTHLRAPFTPNLRCTPHHFNYDFKDGFRPRAASDNLPDFYRHMRLPGGTLPTNDLADVPRSTFLSRKHVTQKKSEMSRRPQEFTVDSREGSVSTARRDLTGDKPRQSRDSGRWLVRPRTWSDTQLHSQHRRWWHVTTDSTALLGDSSPSSSDTDDSCSPFDAVTRNSSRKFQHSYLSGSQRHLSGTHNFSESTPSNARNNSDKVPPVDINNSPGISDASTTESTSGHFGTGQQNPSTAAQHTTMHYLTVPSTWRTRGPSSHPTERRHSNYSNHQQHQHQHHQPDEPLLQQSQDEELLEHQGRTGNYVLTAKTTIWLSTRVVLCLLLLLGTAVVITSLWFMLKCQTRFQPVRPLLPNNSTFCRTMGMPALFAACTLLFTICGLACTGRKFTGYALIVISSVEILQSVTTLTFYNCRVTSAGNVLASVNDSLLKCHAAVQPSGTKARLAQIQQPPGHDTIRYPEWNGRDMPDRGPTSFPVNVRTMRSPVSPTPSLEAQHRPGQEFSSGDHDVSDDNDGVTPRTHLARAGTPGSVGKVRNQSIGPSREGSVRRTRRENKVKVAKLTRRAREAGVKGGQRESMSHISDGNLGVEISMVPGVANQHQLDCSPGSQFFQMLSQTATRETMDKCMSVCQTYQAVCEVSWDDERELLDRYDYYSAQRSPNEKSDHVTRPRAQFASTSIFDRAGQENHGEVLGSNKDQKFRSKRSGRDFQWAVQQCGRRVEQRVHNLCYFDNQVILPMSLGAPVLYIILSCCFIYLARCENVRKMKGNRRKINRSESMSSSITKSPKMRSRVGSVASEDLTTRRIVSWCRKWRARLFHRRRKNFQSNSQSSHELLQLNTVMYSIYTIVGLSMIESSVPVEDV